MVFSVRFFGSGRPTRRRGGNVEIAQRFPRAVDDGGKLDVELGLLVTRDESFPPSSTARHFHGAPRFVMRFFAPAGSPGIVFAWPLASAAPTRCRCAPGPSGPRLGCSGLASDSLVRLVQPGIVPATP